MITPRQMDVLREIDIYIETFGYSPAYIDIMKPLGIGSKSNVRRMIAALSEKGFINWIPYRMRAIEITYKGRRVLGHNVTVLRQPVTGYWFRFDDKSKKLKATNLTVLMAR